MTSKERATLRSAANTLETVYFIGKDGIDEKVEQGVGEALKARELVKIKVQDNCPYTAKEACAALCEALDAQPVQTIGKRFVIYKRNKKIDTYGIE